MEVQFLVLACTDSENSMLFENDVIFWISNSPYAEMNIIMKIHLILYFLSFNLMFI